MADPQLHVIIDAIGRDVQIQIDKAQWDELKNSITSGMKSVVGEVATVISEKTSSQHQEVAAAINQLSSSFSQELADLKRVMGELGGQIDNIGKGGGSPTLSGDIATALNAIQANTAIVSDFIGKEVKSSFAGFVSDVREMKTMASTPGKFFTHDQETHNLLGAVKSAIEACCVGKAAPKPSSAPSSGPTDPSAPSVSNPDLIERLNRVNELVGDATEGEREHGRAVSNNIKNVRQYNGAINSEIDFFYKLKAAIQSVDSTLFGFTKNFDILGNTFKGVTSEEAMFIRNTRQVGYEINGVTGETRGLQDALTDIGKTAKITGADRSEFQAEYLKALKSGIKDQKKALALTTAQLNTEKQLGLEAGELGEQFIKWNNEYNMSNMQIAEMGRGMRDVARFTGLTGKELANAVKSGDQFIEVMRNAAMLSASASKNIMEIAANAQKMGVSKQVEPLIKAMASTTNLFREASSETRAFLFQSAAQVGRVGDLMKGTVLKTKAGIKDMEKGMEMMLKKFGVQSIDTIDTLSEEAKMKLNLQLKAAYGMELGELTQSLKALKESSKTLADRLDDIRKKQQGNLTLEEQLALKEEERRLKTSKSFEMLTSLDEAAKNAKDMNSALSKFGERRKDFEGDLKAMGKSWGSNAGAAREAINEALKGVNESLTKSGKSALTIDSSEIENALKDPKAFRELSAKLSKAEQEAATAQKAALDPMSKIEQGVREVNDTLRDFSSKFLSSYMNLMGVLGILGPTLLAIAASQAINLKILQLNSSLIGQDKKKGPLGFMSKAFGKLSGVLGGDKSGAAGPIEPGAAAGSGEGSGKGVETVAKEGLGGVSHVQDDKVVMLLRDILHCLCNPKANRIENHEFKTMKTQDAANKAQIEQGHVAKAEAKAGAAASAAKDKGGTGGGGGDDTKSILDKIEKLKGDGPRIAKAAGIIAAITIGIVLLGAVLLKLANMLFTKLNLDITTVIKTAAIIGVIMAAAGLIGTALYYAEPHLDKFDKAAGKIDSMVASMWKGAKAIVRLSLPLLAFATALALFGKVVIDLLGLTPGRMALVAGTWVALAVGVAAISEAVIASGPMYAKLPAATAAMQALSKPLWRAAAAFALVSLPLMAFAAILAMFGYVVIDKFGLTPGRMFDIAATWLILAVGVGAIGYALTLALPGWATLGAGLSAVWSIYPMLWSAVAAFGLVSLPLMAFAAAFALFGYIVIDKLGLTPGRMFAIAATWLILAVAVGAIGYAMVNSVAGWFALGAASTVMWAVAKFLLMGAAAFAVVSVPLIVFAGLLAAFGYIVIDQFGLTPKRMFEIAATWLILAVGVGAIGYAMVASSAGWFALGAASTIMWLVAKFLLMGAAAFALISLPLIVFAGLLAAFGAIVIDELGLNQSRLFAIAATWLVLAIGIGAIGYAMIAAQPGWSMLGLAYPVLISTYALMWLGVGAFALVSLPIIALAEIIAEFGNTLDDLGLTPERMKQIGDTFVTLSETVGTLCLSMLSATAKLAILGVLSIFSGLVVGLAMMGTAAFTEMAVPILMLAESIAGFGTFLIDDLGLTPERMQAIQGAFTSLTDTVSELSWKMIAATAKLSILGLLSIFSSMASKFVWLGVFAFATLMKPIIVLGWIMSRFAEMVDIEGVKKAAEACTAIAETISKVPPVIKAMSDELLPLMEPRWWGLAPSKMQKALAVTTGAFRGNFSAILSFISDGIIDPIFGSDGAKLNPKDIEKAGNVMKGLADMLPSIPPVIDALQGPIGDLNSKGWFSGKSKLQKTLEKLKQGFRENFVEILKFVSEGIVDPIFGVGAEGIKLNPKDIDTAARIMNGLATMLPAIPPVIDALNGPIAKLDSKSWFSGKGKLEKTLNKLSKGFQANFTAILRFISNGIIDPIFGIGAGAEGIMLDPRDIQMAAKVMSGLAEMLPAIPTVIDALNGPIASLSSKSWFSGKSKLEKTLMKLEQGFRANFAAILSFVSHGIIDPIFGIGAGAEGVALNPRDIQMAANVMKGLADMLPAISTMIDTLGSGIQSILSNRRLRMKMASIEYFAGWLSNVARMMSEGFVAPVLNMFPKEGDSEKALANLDSMTNMVQKMPPLIDSLGAATEKTSKSVSFWELLSSYSDLSNFMWRAGFLIRQGVIAQMESWPKDSEMDSAVSRITKMDEMFKTMASAMESMAASASAMSKVKFSTPSLGSPEGGNLMDFVSTVAQNNSDAMGMGDTNAMADTMSQQSPQITAMQSALRLVENYTHDIKDLFERSNSVIGDIQKTSEYMSMFGDLDFYENQISEKIAQSKQFVPTVQRIAESIGKGFDFAGGKALMETIAGQKERMAEMAAGLKETEDYTKRLAEIFTMANNAVNLIKQTTTNLTQLNAIKDVEKDITAKIASGNSFMVSVLKTVEAVATNFGTNEEVKTTLMGVQAKIKAAGDTNQALTDCLKFVDTIKQLQSNVLSVGQAAKETKPLGGGVPGAGAPVSLPAANPNLAPETAVTAGTSGGGTDVEKQIMREQATSQPPAGGNKNAIDFSSIERAIEENRMTNEQMLAVLQAMLRLMTPRSGSSTAPAGDTSTYSRPDKPASYYRSPVGDFNSSSGKGATNMVRVR